MECRTVESDRRQIWYLARHLKQLSADLAAWGLAEAALLVGAAALSVGDQTVQPRSSANAPRNGAEPALQQGGIRHG